ncbi:MAG TPA: AMP-binding protein [Acidimicrobiia bacterium]|nr:AMP-binding protein [Acidimicrobiia bacterium]
MPVSGQALDAPVDLSHLVDGLARETPDRVAVRSPERSTTWAQLDAASARLARNYLRLGLAPGDRVASLMPNRERLLLHYLACFRAGLVVTPLNYRYAGPEIDHALEVSGAAMLVAHAERVDDLARCALVPDLRLGVVTAEGSGGATTLESLLAADTAPVDLTPALPDEPAAIFFTSGSTGPAKGVTHSLATLGWMTATAARGFELTPDDRFLPASSMSHIGAFLWTLASLSVGGQAVIAHTFDAGGVLPLLREHRPTVLAMIPAALVTLVRDHDVTADDFASLRLCRSGADKVPDELEREFVAVTGFPIDEGYGMTEVGLATLNPPSGEIRAGSIGRPVAGVVISVRDDDGNEVAPGIVGRVWINTPGTTIGYWENPEATAEIMRDDWLDSGDLAHADDDGYLWFFGRKKQIIVHDGSNISPVEVESALDDHPAVALSGVVGIHDVVHGENVRAYVTLQHDAPRPTAHDLIEFAREQVGYKAPDEIVFLDAMPLNPTGKIDRVALKRLAEEHVGAHPGEHGGREKS